MCHQATSAALVPGMPLPGQTPSASLSSRSVTASKLSPSPPAQTPPLWAARPLLTSAAPWVPVTAVMAMTVRFLLLLLCLSACSRVAAASSALGFSALGAWRAALVDAPPCPGQAEDAAR